MYITVEELGVPEDMLIRLTDDEGSGMVDAARAESAIQTAQSGVDAALSRYFDTPLAEPTGLMKSLTRDIAVYNLYLRVGGVPEQVAAAYTAASEMLEKASAGLFHLGLTESDASPGVSGPGREFTREYMEGL
jgi:phage gp36-like protein